MPKITKLEVQKKNKERASVFLDGEFAFGIHIEIAMKYSLCKGMEIDQDFMDKVLKEDEQQKANNYALNLLSFSSKTEQQLRDKMLKKEYAIDIIDNTVEMLKRHKYLDDKRYAENFAKDKMAFYKDGKRKIQQDLYLKGVDKEVIQEVLEEVTDEDMEYSRALEIAKKKVKSYKKDEARKQYHKLGSFLQRKGFSYDVISKVLRCIFKGEDNL